ncbi:hypothetical protein [Variovorax soli]|uniref:Transposase n=1 Tax=Variovorax soli TaxID=376815 RepID=A0ABU1NM00_9BURK|nr:hypothetical protein [Variovorax soli]MDR6539484.1 hypothetical protein [Variovorax soli]
MIEVDPTAPESTARRKIVEELRGSAFLHCDVNKEHVLLCIKHGTNLIKAQELETEELKWCSQRGEGVTTFCRRDTATETSARWSCPRCHEGTSNRRGACRVDVFMKSSP